MERTTENSRPIRRTGRMVRGERGVAMFIVMMLVVMVSAAGVFVTRSASLEVRSAGFVRQAGQTHYIAESGATSVITRLRLNCPAFMNDALRQSALAGDSATAGCPEVRVSSSEVYRKPCYRFVNTDGAILGAGSLSIFENGSGAGAARTPGSFGPGFISPSFRVTVTELYGDLATPDGLPTEDPMFRQSRLMIDVAGMSELDRSLAAYSIDSNNVARGAEALRAITVILCSN